MGTLDWVFFSVSGDVDAASLIVSRAHQGGEGIDRAPRVFGTVKPHGRPRSLPRQFEWSLQDGAAPAVCQLSLPPEAGVGFTFAPGTDGRARLGALWLDCVQGEALTVTVRQGRDERLMTLTGPCWVQVVFDGPESLQVRVAATGNSQATVTGFAAILSDPGEWWIRDGRFVFFWSPVSQQVLLGRGKAHKQSDFLERAKAFADCILRYGWDRYGPVKSPLFSNILTREPAPQTTPLPRFTELSPAELRQQEESNARRLAEGLPVTVFGRFNYNRILNYPKGLGRQGPHKVTLYGSDPIEDVDLYFALYELSAASGDDRYRAAADAALSWWYANTQQAGGLYPWGEHSGWDLVEDAPTYFQGPLREFFLANYHEVSRFPVFPELLAGLPAPPGHRLSPLERYALGIWQQHFWDKERAYFNRHADLNGVVSQIGQLGGYPAHLAYYWRIWALALTHGADRDCRNELTLAFHRTLQMALSRTRKYGFFPFDFSVDRENRPAGSVMPPQSRLLAHCAFELSEELAGSAPAIAAGLRELADLHLGSQPAEETRWNIRLAVETGDRYFLMGKPPPDPGRMIDFSAEVLSEAIAQETINCLWFYRETGQREYLDLAGHYARIAWENFCDERSPLPRAFALGAPLRTPEGELFPDFYFRGATLMRAFVQYAVAEEHATVLPIP